MAGVLDMLAKDDEGDDEAPEDMGSAKSKKVRAIRRLFAAMKSNDAEAGAEAFADAFKACEMYEGDEEEADPLGDLDEGL